MQFIFSSAPAPGAEVFLLIFSIIRALRGKFLYLGVKTESMDDRKSAIDFLKTSTAVPQMPDATPAEWEWPISEQVEKQLKMMGVYDIMREQIYIIGTSASKAKIEIAKSKIDGLTKSMNLIKATMSVLESSGSDVDENRISEIDIRMHLDEDDDNQE